METESNLTQHTKRIDAINLTRGEVMAGISGYSKEDQADLLWLHGYCTDEFAGSRSRTCEALKLDWTTLWRIWCGKYEAGPEKVLEKVRRFRKKMESSLRKRFIRTVVTEKIFAVCDVALERSVMVMVSGPTGRSKTWTITEWKHQNNHGRAIYVYCPEAGGFRSLLQALAEALNISPKRDNASLISAIENSLDERNVLVLDEFAHLYPSGRSGDIKAIEFIRGLHDRTGCGAVLCATEGLEGILQFGKYSQWFNQFLGRIDLHLRIPRQFSRREVAELLGGYVDDPDPDLINAARTVANASTRGCRDLLRHLDRAATVAQEIKQPLSAEILNQTIAAGAKLLTIEKD